MATQIGTAEKHTHTVGLVGKGILYEKSSWQGTDIIKKHTENYQSSFIHSFIHTYIHKYKYTYTHTYMCTQFALYIYIHTHKVKKKGTFNLSNVVSYKQTMIH